MMLRKLLPLLFLYGCGDDDPPRVRIASFVASPGAVKPGQTATLRWKVENARRLQIVGPQGVEVLRPTIEAEGTVETPVIQGHTSFVLTAEGEGGPVGATAVVAALFDPPVIERFEASPRFVRRGEEAVLGWSTINTESVAIEVIGSANIIQGMPVGSQVVAPQTTTAYRLIARGPGGETSAQTEVVVEGTPPVVVAFMATPSRIQRGQASRLSWNVAGATEIVIRDPGGVVRRTNQGMGNVEVQPEASTSYFLEATNPDGSANAETTVAVDQPQPPIITVFEASPNPGPLGGVTTLRWEAPGAAQVRGLLGAQTLFSSTNPTGQQTFPLTASSTVVTLVASNTFGEVRQTQTIYAHAAPSITEFVATPALLSSGMVSLRWNVTSVNRLRLLANGQEVLTFPGVPTSSNAIDSAGTFSVTATTTTGFELIAQSGGGMDSEAALVVVGIAEVEPNDSRGAAQVLPAAVDVGASATGPDRDYYALDVPRGGQVAAQTFTAPGQCTRDTRLVLTSSSAMVLVDDGAPGCGRIDPARHPTATNLEAGTYYLLVEGNGTYVLRVSVTGPVCGDGRREGLEDCDDGNQTPSDGCSAQCTFEPSAPVNPPGATLSVAIPPSGFAVIPVALTRAGQGLTAVAQDPGGGCTLADTHLALVGPDRQTLGEKAEGGPVGSAGRCAAILRPQDRFATDLALGVHHILVRSKSGAGATVSVALQIQEPACGNTILETRAAEQCDDGNLVGGDGCSAMCRREGSVLNEVEPNDTQLTATPTNLGGPGVVTLVGQTSPAGDDDVFEFSIPAAQNLRFTARTYTLANQPNGCDSTVSDTRIFLERQGLEATMPGTGEVAFNDDIDNAGNIWCSRLTNILLSGGAGGARYYLRVQGWLDQAETSYRLDLRLQP